MIKKIIFEKTICTFFLEIQFVIEKFEKVIRSGILEVFGYLWISIALKTFGGCSFKLKTTVL